MNNFKPNFNFYFKRILLLFIVYHAFSLLVHVKFSTCKVVSPKLQESKFKEVKYVVILISSPENFERRITVRYTWFNLLENIIGIKRKRYKWSVGWKQTHRNWDYIRFYFVIGTKNISENVLTHLQRENSLYNDLLLLQEYEENTMLTKKLLLSFNWVHKNFPKLKYLIKCNDDTFVRIDKVIHDLENKKITKPSKITGKYLMKQGAELADRGLYWGFLTGERHILNNETWKDDKSFVCDSNYYVLYALGGGYVVSKTVVDYVGANEHWLSKNAPEDIAMGIWTSSLGIMRAHDLRFDSDWASRPCKSYMMIRHHQNKSQMINSYVNLVRSKGENICKGLTKPTRRMNSVIQQTQKKTEIFTHNK